MDIDGDEYINLINIDTQKFLKIRIMILELHDLRNLRSHFFYKIFDEVINKLSKYFYFCYLHPNNLSYNLMRMITIQREGRTNV